jgi:hypothetical protein
MKLKQPDAEDTVAAAILTNKTELKLVGLKQLMVWRVRLQQQQVKLHVLQECSAAHWLAVDSGVSQME